MFGLEPFVLSTTAATALGAYNIARFIATNAIEKRRKIKETKEMIANVKAAVKYAKDVRTKIVAGDIDKEKLAAAIDYLKNLTSSDDAQAA